MVTAESTPGAEPEWLTPDELETWNAINLLITTLPGALGGQLQRNSDLSFLEYYVLAILSDQPQHSVRMGLLAFLVNSERSRLSHLMRRLEKRGLVRRETDPTDRRFTLAILTATGQAEVNKAAPGHVEHVRRLIFDALDVKEQHALRDALKKIQTKVGPVC